MIARSTLVALLCCLAGCAQRLVSPLDYAPIPPSIEEPFRAQPPPQRTVVDAKEVLRETTLPNGLHVVVVERHNFPSVAIRLRVDRGAVDFDDVDAASIDQMLHLFGRAGDLRTFERLQRECADNGVGWQLDGDADGVTAGAYGPSRSFAVALSVLARVSFQANLSPQEYDQRVAEWKQGGSYSLPHLAERAVLFGPHHPYGHSPEAHRSPLSREAASSLHARIFQPAHATAVIVGDVTLSDVDALAGHWFGSWVGNDSVVRNAHPPPAVSGPRLSVVSRRDLAQRSAAVFARGPLVTNEDSVAFEVAARILGGAHSSTLAEALREHSGATYGVSSPLYSQRTASWLSIAASYESEKAVESVRRILVAIDTLRSNRESDEEIAVAKATLIAKMRGMMATPSGAAALYSTWIAHGRNPSNLADYPAWIDRVGRDDLTRVARSYLALDSLHVVFVGEDRWLDTRSLGLGEPVALELWK